MVPDTVQVLEAFFGGRTQLFLLHPLPRQPYSFGVAQIPPGTLAAPRGFGDGYLLTDWKVHVYTKNDEGQQCHERKRERREKESRGIPCVPPPPKSSLCSINLFINPCPPHRGMAKRDLRQIFIILNSPPLTLVRLSILSSLLVEYRLLSDPCFSVMKGLAPPDSRASFPLSYSSRVPPA